MCLHYWLFNPLNRGSYDRFCHVLLCIFEFPRLSLLRNFYAAGRHLGYQQHIVFAMTSDEQSEVKKFWNFGLLVPSDYCTTLSCWGTVFQPGSLPRSNLCDISPHFMIIDEFKLTLPGSNYKFVFKISSIPSFTCEWKWHVLIWATSVPIEFIACDLFYYTSLVKF